MIDGAVGRHTAAEKSVAARRPRWLASVSASDRERPSGKAAAIVLLPLVLLVYAALLLPDATVSWMLREEHPIELLGALSLLAAAIACAVLWLHVRQRNEWTFLRRLSLVALTVVFFFGFGEEISWGQRILGFGTPASLDEANAQDETNVHNLAALGGWLDMDRLFQVFWLLLGVVIPLLALWARPRRFLRRFVPILPVALAGLFVLNQVLTKAFHELLTRNPELWNSTKFSVEHGTFETKETVSCLLLATGLWLLVLRARAPSALDGPDPGRAVNAEIPPAAAAAGTAAAKPGRG